ncbi:DivIVA domain-containing protein [Streptomyces sp. AJS327]|uniref:DivIVA domain-containing protein n=1 Tax=Streptomyces sp. AJS327 TaxID=2545265 RepID=UPI0015DEA761|nr:DivIVA domain-containing protein [Streptomyces sp. AJS327]MBA0051420.1 DivIVA domain-containing protein [Streptomyces sp. AJS327]
MFWFLLISLVVVVAAVTLAVVGSGEGEGRAVGGLADAEPELLDQPLPDHRPVGRADVEELRFPVAVRGYHMRLVDDALDRLGAELAERDARIAELESTLAGAQAVALSGTVPAGYAVPARPAVPGAEPPTGAPAPEGPGHPGGTGTSGGAPETGHADERPGEGRP